MNNTNNLSSLIWSSADDVLRNLFKPSEYFLKIEHNRRFSLFRSHPQTPDSRRQRRNTRTKQSLVYTTTPRANNSSGVTRQPGHCNRYPYAVWEYGCIYGQMGNCIYPSDDHTLFGRRCYPWPLGWVRRYWQINAIPSSNTSDQYNASSHLSPVLTRLSRMRALHKAGHISDADLKRCEEAVEEIRTL